MKINTFDGSEIEINPVHGTVGRWEENYCWNCGCGNRVHYIEISNKTGKAKRGYCYFCFRLRRYEEKRLFKKTSRWYEVLKGKLKEVKEKAVR